MKKTPEPVRNHAHRSIGLVKKGGVSLMAAQTRLIVGRFGTSLVSDGPGGCGCLRWGYNGARGKGVGSTRPKCCFRHVKLFNECKPWQLYIGLGTLVVSSFPCHVCDQSVARMYKLRIVCHHHGINWSRGRETNDGSFSL